MTNVYITVKIINIPITPKNHFMASVISCSCLSPYLPFSVPQATRVLLSVTANYSACSITLYKENQMEGMSALLSLSTIILRFIPTGVCIRVHFFVLVSSLPLLGCVTIFFSLYCWTFGLWLVLAITDNAAKRYH